jgi:signal transduction histidine kinase
MRISVFILTGFMVILSLFAITTYINFRLSEQVDENTTYLSLSAQIVRDANRFQRNILNLTSGLNGFLFTGEDYFLQAYDSAVMENESILLDLARAPEESAQSSLVAELKQLNEKWIRTHANPLIVAKRNEALSDSSKREFLKVYNAKRNDRSSAIIVQQLNSLIKGFINNEYAVRDVRRAALRNSIEATRMISIVLTTFSIVMGFMIAVFLAINISRRIMTMVAMANNIASGNYEVYTKDRGRDELGRLASSLNNMAKVLSENIRLLKRKNTELDQFAHIVSHDIKAPLRGIDNVVTWIEEDHWNELSPKVKEYMGLIKARVLRGEALIKGILSYSRAGQHSIAKEEVNLNQLLADIKEGFTLPNQLEIHLPSDLPVIATERVPLMQVFSNLISNAIKYNDKPKGKINVAFREHSDRLEFLVEDNGPGIAVQYHEKIFKIFQTLNGDSFENTGVGLAIVKKILDDRKQKISIQSEPGIGATFSFTWPK